MTKNLGKKIGIIGNQSTTVDLIESILRSKYQIDCIITMPTNLNGRISGWVDVGNYAKEKNIPVIYAKSFSLMHEDDKKNIISRNIDVLLVFGWQRLIPEWFLNNLSIGAFGTHGSWKKLPYGRGRSLLNWSLILGKNKLIDNLFRYDAGADSGDIIESFRFEITPFDTISSLHHKDQLVHQELILKHLPSILKDKISYIPQSKKIKEVFFPKRRPEDGVIDWKWNTINLYNLIRALQKPYPGAFTFYKTKKIMIWDAMPFQLYTSFRSKKPGTIVASFSDGTFLVRTLDGVLYITDYESNDWNPQINMKLISKKNRTFDLLRKSGIM